MGFEISAKKEPTMKGANLFSVPLKCLCLKGLRSILYLFLYCWIRLLGINLPPADPQLSQAPEQAGFLHAAEVHLFIRPQPLLSLNLFQEGLNQLSSLCKK